jgi:hypothetical protein
MDPGLRGKAALVMAASKGPGRAFATEPAPRGCAREDFTFTPRSLIGRKECASTLGEVRAVGTVRPHTLPTKHRPLRPKCRGFIE